jgi:hypothetical protein
VETRLDEQKVVLIFFSHIFGYLKSLFFPTALSCCVRCPNLASRFANILVMPRRSVITVMLSLNSNPVIGK